MVEHGALCAYIDETVSHWRLGRNDEADGVLLDFLIYPADYIQSPDGSIAIPCSAMSGNGDRY